MRGPTGVATFVVIIGVVVSHASGDAQQTGTVSGRVTLTSRIRGAPLPSNTYQPRIVSRRDDRAVQEIRNVVVYLKDPGYRGALPAERHLIRQENETFLPSVLAITRGSTVDFLNADPIFHNVFSLSSALTFDLGRYPQGKSRTPRAFGRAGLVKVYCHIHSHMSASILVLDHPYFATPGPDGSYVVSDVPAGHYTIAGWHERVGERRVPIQVHPGEVTTVDLALPVEGVG
jgi:plastocyanin